MSICVVVPTTGRPALQRMLGSLAAALRHDAAGIERVVVVDDRGPGAEPALAAPDAVARVAFEVVAGPARGPAAARNVGWRRAGAPWIAFLDDDVVVPRAWARELAEDLVRCGGDVAGCQGRIVVPLPVARRPTDWERDVAGLAGARWATADMAYRRTALDALGGFDERFPRAYREDADLAVRALRAGYRLVRGRRAVVHPPGPPALLASVRRQAGNADDVLMDALHGPGWRALAGAPRGRLRANVATTTLLAAALSTAAMPFVSRKSAYLRFTWQARTLTDNPGPARAVASAWLGATATFAAQRIAPGPRTPRELLTMLLTSVLVPPAATWHRCAGVLRRQRLLATPGPPAQPQRWPSQRPEAVLLDRDGTLVADVPYNGDPACVTPLPGVADGLRRLRRAGCRLAIVSNQSGIARGLLTAGEVRLVNDRVEELLGPLGPWLVCPHGPRDGCDCRKPAPGLLRAAAATLGVAIERCAVIGDIGADVEAALAAGARPVLVPTEVTRPDEVAAAPEVAADFLAAVDLLLGEDDRDGSRPATAAAGPPPPLAAVAERA